MQDVILLTKSNAQLTVRSPLYSLTISGQNLIYNKIDITVITLIAVVQLPTSYDHHRLRYRMQDVILVTKSNAQLTVRSPLYSLTSSG